MSQVSLVRNAKDGIRVPRWLPPWTIVIRATGIQNIDLIWWVLGVGSSSGSNPKLDQWLSLIMVSIGQWLIHHGWPWRLIKVCWSFFHRGNRDHAKISILIVAIGSNDRRFGWDLGRACQVSSFSAIKLAVRTSETPGFARFEASFRWWGQG